MRRFHIPARANDVIQAIAAILILVVLFWSV